MKYGNSRLVTVAPVINTSQYADGDLLGGIQSIGPLGAVTGRGVLKHVAIVDKGDEKPILTILLFKALPTGGTYTNNVPPALSADDYANLIGKVEIGADDWTTVVTASLAVATKETSLVVIGDDLRTVYALVLNHGSPTYAVGDVTFQYGLLLD